MAAYLVYAEQAPAIAARYGGRYIARGPATVPEGDHQPMMIVLLEFPSMEQLHAFYNSDDSAPLMALRQQGSNFNFLAVDGLG